MSFFDDNQDPFEDLVRDFFGGRNVPRDNSNNFIKNEVEERNIDFVETKDSTYLIFEIPGFEEKDVKIDIKGHDLQIEAKKKIDESVPEYLVHKLQSGKYFKKTLPKSIKKKKFTQTVKNGVLEIEFKRK